MAISKSKRTIEFVLTAKDRTKRAFNNATQGMKKLATSAASFAKSIGLGLGLFSGAAGAGAVAALRNQVDELDRLGKASESLGIAVEELSKLRHGAELTGSSLTGMIDALEKMLNRVSKAAEGTGEAKDAIVELGFDAAELEKLAPQEMFKELATAIAAVGSSADKVRLKRAIFGRGDSNIINLINQGRAGIEGMADDLEDLNGVVTDADTNAAADLADSMLRMSTSIDALGRSVGGPVIGGINDLLAFFRLGTGIDQVNSDIKNFRTEIERTQRMLDEGGDGFLESFASIFTPDSVLRERLEKQRKALDELLKIRDDYNKKRADQEKNAEALEAARQQNQDQKKIADAGLKTLKGSLKAREAEFKRHESALAASRDKQKELLQSIADASKEFEDFGKETPTPDRFDLVEATGAAWDNINAGDTSGARAAIQALIDMFREYQEAGRASLADVELMTSDLEALGKATQNLTGAGLEERAVRAAAAAQDLKDEIEGKPIEAPVGAAEGSGKVVRDQTQEQVLLEQPVVVQVGIQLAGQIWGTGAPTQRIPYPGAPSVPYPGSDVENESNKRGFRI